MYIHIYIYIRMHIRTCVCIQYPSSGLWFRIVVVYGLGL